MTAINATTARKNLYQLIADVNDLKRSRVVGVSNGVNGQLASQLLLDNPFGNASEKTPICIIKNYRQYQESHTA